MGKSHINSSSFEMLVIALFSFCFIQVLFQILEINFIHWSFVPYCVSIIIFVHSKRSARDNRVFYWKMVMRFTGLKEDKIYLVEGRKN